MKRTIIIFLVCVPVVFAGNTDGYLDGFITADDGYQFGVIWISYDPPLIVDGGGHTIYRSGRTDV